MDNFYSAEMPIIDRLKERLELSAVYSQADIDGLRKSGGQPDEAVAVIYRDFRVQDADQESLDLLLFQRWLIVPMSRNVREIATGAGARDAAGELLLRVIKALNGWRPTAEHGPLLLTAPGAPRQYRDGVAYAPAQFETLIRIETDN